jgi:hypothetical protein
VCETQSLTLRVDYRLKVVKKSVLGKTHGPKTQAVPGGWTKFHSAELHNLYSSQNIIQVINSRRKRWVGHVAHTAERRGAHRN